MASVSSDCHGLDCDRLSDHNVKLNMLLRTLQVDILLQLEAELAIDNPIDFVATLKIARSALRIGYA